MGGGELVLGAPQSDNDWQMVVVYRDRHCPVCTRYLGDLNAMLPKLTELGIDLVVVSADPQEKAANQIDPIAPTYAVGYDLTIEQMQALGSYISHPHSATETDRPFAEPGLVVVNADDNLQVTDISNVPFARPDFTGHGAWVHSQP